ncbi:glycoside hydrolase family 26 protein [Plantactinospora sp. CA-294935]|uniref:glycoside hydrolase family 26 protein n=1 Tax=Plantactinospora sp. CA-294935 TaxID=3240012 RepID=UPI003D8D175C
MVKIDRRTLLALAGSAVAGAYVGAAGGRPAAAATPGLATDLVPATGAHFGAYVYAGNDSGVSQPEALESKIGHGLRINHSFQHAGTALPLTRIQQDIAAGRIPMLSWGAGEEARLREILAGLHDTEIEGQARRLAELGAPMFLRYTWEFDLRYTDTKLFTDTWRYVHWKFAQAPNVAFVWCPTWRAYRETFKAEDFYPGDEHVDWIAADGYARPRPDRPEYDYRPFDLMFDVAHAYAVAQGKPFMVGETGVHRAAVDPVQAEWLDSTRSVIRSSYPNLKAFLYFHRDGDDPDNHWRVTVPDGGPAQRAFAAFAADPYFNPPFDPHLDPVGR